MPSRPARNIKLNWRWIVTVISEENQMSLGQKQLPAKIARAKALLEKPTPAEREQALKVAGKMADRAVQKRREVETN